MLSVYTPIRPVATRMMSSAWYEWRLFVAAKIILVSPEQVLPYMTLFTCCLNRPLLSSAILC